jgi:uncharacterized protein
MELNMGPITMKSVRRLAYAGVLALMLAPCGAMAQFSQGYNFLKAVRESDGGKATEMLDKPGSTIVNARDVSTGDTGLLISTARRDLAWMGFLLGKGANPNLANNQEMTPLIQATLLRFADGVQLLLANRAQVDLAGRNGETALIHAVMLRDLPTIRLLLTAGANASKRDLTGMSARDYAERDAHNTAIIELMNKTTGAKQPSGAVQGPVF